MQPAANDPGGLRLVHVEDDEGGPIWSYTVGLWRAFEQPEVVVFGLPVDLAEQLFEALMDAVEDGARYAAGTQHDGLLRGYPVCFRRVDAAQCRGLLPAIAAVHAADDVPCVQLVYPDKQGRWPWQPDVRDGFRKLQPVLEDIAVRRAQ
jgi:hypothetical protein